MYDDPGRTGHEYRVLVDRLWPRGVAKASFELDRWEKQVAPSAELRRWYGHEPARFEEFAQRYRSELDAEPAASALADLRSHLRNSAVVLLTATRDVEHSGAEVLRSVLTGH